MNKGFSLIEALIAISLSAIIMTAGLFLLSNHTKMSGRINKNISTQQICSMIIDKLSEDIQNANGVSPLSNQSKLILVYPKDNLIWEYKNNKIKRKTQYITDSGDISDLSFQYDGKLVEIILDKYTTKALCRN